MIELALLTLIAADPELDRCVVQLEYTLEWKDPKEIPKVRLLPLDGVLKAVGEHKGLHFSVNTSLLLECQADLAAYGDKAR